MGGGEVGTLERTKNRKETRGVHDCHSGEKRKNKGRREERVIKAKNLIGFQLGAEGGRPKRSGTTRQELECQKGYMKRPEGLA